MREWFKIILAYFVDSDPLHAPLAMINHYINTAILTNNRLTFRKLENSAAVNE